MKGIGRLRSVHQFTVWHRLYLLSLCVGLGLVAQVGFSILVSCREQFSGESRSMMLFAAFCVGLVGLVFLGAVRSVIRIWGDKIEVYDKGLKVDCADLCRFVRWSEMRALIVERPPGDYDKPLFTTKVYSPYQAQATIDLRDGETIFFHSGFKGMEHLLHAVSHKVKTKHIDGRPMFEEFS